MPRATSTVVLPFSVRSRMISNPCFSPGHLWCSVMIVVTRNVLFSSRPCPLSTVATALERFAVQRQVVGLRRQTRADPAAQGLLQRLRVQAAEGARQGGFGGRPTAAEAQRVRQGCAVVAAELGHGVEAASAQKQ